MFLTDLNGAELEELGLSSSRPGYGSKDVQQPRHGAHYAQHGHMGMYALYCRMLNAAYEVVEVFSEPNLAHDIEAKEHCPRRHIHRASGRFDQLRSEQVCLGLDARLICTDSYVSSAFPGPTVAHWLVHL